VDYTTNADWFNVQQGSAAEAAMKAKLHRGSMKDFNVYSAAPRGSGGEAIAGFTKLPMFAKVPACATTTVHWRKHGVWLGFCMCSVVLTV
jgi:hypothetical protein